MNLTYLEHVRNAKDSLRIWLSNVEQIHNGIQMFSKENDLNRKNTDFAKWYYSEGQTFSSFESFTVLESFYEEMYDIFIEYTTLNNLPVKKGFFSNNSEKRKNELNNIYTKLKSVTRKLIKLVDIFEEKLIKSPLFDIPDGFESNISINSPSPSIIKEEDHSIVANQLDRQEGKIENTPSIPDGNESLSNSSQDTNTNEDDFELRLQEEVSKIRKQLEIEFSNKQKETLKENDLIVDNVDKESEIDKESQSTSKLKSDPNKKQDIDIDEEIRRILS